jgi:GH15 family glucan-1,4-alpha-glucosidase
MSLSSRFMFADGEARVSLKHRNHVREDMHMTSHGKACRDEPYPPIGDYGFISDCHSSALISKAGSIDWCCMPRIDSASCFARLLGWDNGGFCQIIPSSPFKVSRSYLDKTLILETVFEGEKGISRLLDFFTMREEGEHRPHRQILRIIEALEGEMEFLVEIQPRFDFGAIRPWLRKAPAGHFIAMGGSEGLLFSGDLSLDLPDRHRLTGRCNLKKGERRRLSILSRKPEELDEGLALPPEISELDRRLNETRSWWERWSSRARVHGPYGERALRSAIVLKGLTNAPTGAIAAAATTSLPESPGGSRNWDYRFTWIRDSTFTVRSLAELGFVREADGFRRFVERTAAGNADEIQVLFGVGGERRLHEYEIPGLCGYKGASPVRIGNAAEGQVQLDVYGELLELAWIWHNRRQSPDSDYWEFVQALVNRTIKVWRGPDQGIWEIRGDPRHFVHSKVMCWVALDRGIKMAEGLGADAPLEKWKNERDTVRAEIETKGYDRTRGVFIQAFGYPIMDSALLLLPIFGFVEFRDERMVRTVDAIRGDLEEDGLLKRYASDSDNLKGTEGTFISCSFWLAECLALQGRLKEAHAVLQRASATGNDLGLFSEEFDTGTGEMLGNFPQGLTHLSHVAAVMAIARMEKAV